MEPGRSAHDRKFMLSHGSLYDWTTRSEHRSVSLSFWGEWEGPSIFWKVDSPGKPLPAVVHAPFRPIHRPSSSFQNTDPMVFGDAFVYSNCLQATYASLRTLTAGSLVLFGRFSRVHGRPRSAWTRVWSSSASSERLPPTPKLSVRICWPTRCSTRCPRKAPKAT